MLHAFDHMDADGFDNVMQYRQQLNELLTPADQGKHIFYAVTERGDTTGGVPAAYQQMILDALYCMNKLVPYHENEELERFKIAFTAKFEGREIPLLMALDPEVGIGYDNQGDVVYREEALLKDVQFEDPKDQSKFLKWTPAHSLLLNKVHQQLGDYNAYQIVLTEKDLAALPNPRGKNQLPPSISVVFRLYNGLLYLESAGGASAASLIGRFSAFNDRFLHLATEIAEKEQEHNPDVLFAEIAHICDTHAANINRRKHVRQYELPVMVMSTLEGERQLELSDLYISVRNGQIVLRSKKNDAVVIPRLSTAFNHQNSDLSVFRFLCDLQYQDLRAGFKLELDHFFPGLRFYPRVVYKSSILSLATWQLEAGDFAAMKTGDAGRQFNLFNELASQIKLPRHFALTQHDNHLVFDRDQEEDVLLFLDAIKHYDKITLTEFLMNDEGRSDVTDSQGKPLIGQYTAALCLNETVYNFTKAVKFEEATAGHRNFAPGTEWTYFKIYCHQALANELLCSALMPLLEWVYDRKIIDKWFYIRYNDPDHHIRLRLHTLNGQSDMLMALFSQQLRTLLDEQKIEKYHIDIYVRELERYAPATIDDVESFFFGSSLLTLSYMRRSAQDEILHSYNLDFIMLSMDEMLNAFKQPLAARVALFQKLYLSFYEEFKGDKNLKKSLEKKYADLRQEIKRSHENHGDLKAVLGNYCSLLHNYCRTIAEKVQHEPPGVIEKIQADLIHMHLNRLFVQNPRKQELIIYYLLYKHYNALEYKNQLAS
jgi:thiopeptide-type bacteriocin biosynthesis protein